MHKLNQLNLVILALLLSLTLGIVPYAARAQTTEPEPPFSFDILGNGTYQNEFSEDREVTLTNGQYEDEENRLFLTLTGYVAYGDLTGDALDEAVVVLATNGGGTGVFYNLAVVEDVDGTLTNVATTLLGDRVDLNDLAIVDGQIMVDMITQGPDDANCCPTLQVQNVYALVNGELMLVSTEEIGTEDEEGVFAPAADPTAAMLFLGGADYYWLDPTLVSIHSGAVTGPGLNANTLGQGCAGMVDERPDVILNWSEDESVDILRLFFLSMGDPSMVVVTPDGDVVCNDDLNPLVLDPYLEFDNPVPGRYAIFIGSFEGNTTTPGFLVATGQEYSPATMDIAQMFPRHANPGAVGEQLSIDVLELDGEPEAEIPTEPLTSTTIPYTQTLVAGGELGAYEIELDNDLCTGFIHATPTYAFEWEGEAENLVFFFEAAADTTLVVRDPNGMFQCNDDADDAANLNPYLDLLPMAGTYQLWLGSFEPTTLVTGTLTIASTTEVQPASLTSDAIGE